MGHLRHQNSKCARRRGLKGRSTCSAPVFQSWEWGGLFVGSVSVSGYLYVRTYSFPLWFHWTFTAVQWIVFPNLTDIETEAKHVSSYPIVTGHWLMQASSHLQAHGYLEGVRSLASGVIDSCKPPEEGTGNWTEAPSAREGNTLNHWVISLAPDFSIVIFLKCVLAFCLLVCLCNMCLMPAEAREGCQSLELALPIAVVSCHLGSGTQTLVLWKSSEPSLHHHFAQILTLKCTAGKHWKEVFTWEESPVRRQLQCAGRSYRKTPSTSCCQADFRCVTAFFCVSGMMLIIIS